MILVDIQIPILDKCFDFELDEEIKAGELLKKIKEILTDRGNKITENEEKPYFYALYQERLLKEELSLKEQGIVTGEKLFLI